MGGFSPIRRNRNIGTAKSGHGQDNRMTIPKIAHGLNDFWERIENARQVSRTVSERLITFFVQPTLKDSVLACTVDDIARMLSLLPKEDWEGIEAVFLRQPCRKEQILAPTWGRLAYAAQLVDKRGTIAYCGPAIIIEAINPSKPTKYGRALSLAGIAELERLKAEGHKVLPKDKNHTIESTLENCRTTQLYRTLLHEVGHWLDFLEEVERPVAAIDNRGNPEAYEQLLRRFHKRPSQEKEQFAHAYAQRLRQHLLDNRAIPFERQLNRHQLKIEGLRLHDFELPQHLASSES
jgi:hypothetical protein